MIADSLVTNQNLDSGLQVWFDRTLADVRALYNGGNGGLLNLNDDEELDMFQEFNESLNEL